MTIQGISRFGLITQLRETQLERALCLSINIACGKVTFQDEMNGRISTLSVTF